MRVAFLILLGVLHATGQSLLVEGPTPSTLSLGQTARVTLRLPGADQSAALGLLPSIPGLELTPRPVKVTGADAAPRWEIRIEPLRPGAFRIPPLSVEFEGKSHQTSTLHLVAERDAAGEALVEISLSAPDRVIWQGEDVTVSLRLRVSESVASEELLQLFRQRLDLPVQVLAPFLEGLPAAERVGGAVAAPGARPARLVIGEEIGTASRLEDEPGSDGPWRVYRLAATLRPRAAGRLRIPGVRIKFAFATEFEDDFIRGRVPVNRRTGCAYAAGLELRIEEPPVEGRPSDYGGAVGRFAVASTIDASDLEVGRSFQLTLRITGEGNLDGFRAPELTGLEGFHVRGYREGANREAGQRTILYELVPLVPGAQRIPRLPFSAFDPQTGRYATVRTEEIAVRVARGDAGVAAVAPATPVVPGRDDVFPLKAMARRGEAETARLPLALIVTLLVLPFVAGLGFAFLKRWIEHRRRDAAARRVRRAAARFRRGLRRDGADVERLLVRCLAAFIDGSVPMVVSPRLPGRLGEVGVGTAEAREMGDLVEAMVSARYGGHPAAVDPARLDRTVTGLEQAILAEAAA